MNTLPQTIENLEHENKNLLSELELAYKNMATIVEQSNKEKEIAYSELQDKFKSLEELYSELSSKENKLIHLEKLSSVGQFITEIIHELNSPVTAISGQVELMRYLEPTDEIVERLDLIAKEIDRIGDYFNRFKGMVYKGHEDFGVFDLNENLLECLGTIEIIKPKDVFFDIDLCADSLHINGDPYQTNQIFLNLSKNAFDAMDGKGCRMCYRSRKVSTEWLQQPKNYSEIACLKKSQWDESLKEAKQFALIEIEDSGSGIPADRLRDIFKPFVTSKGRGKGTGLGLSIASDVAKRHAGNLAVFSTPGQGTTFQFAVPLSTGA